MLIEATGLQTFENVRTLLRELDAALLQLEGDGIGSSQTRPALIGQRVDDVLAFASIFLQPREVDPLLDDVLAALASIGFARRAFLAIEGLDLGRLERLRLAPGEENQRGAIERAAHGIAGRVEGDGTAVVMSGSGGPILCVPFPPEASCKGALYLERGEGDPPFTETEAPLFRALLAHLDRALPTTRALHEHRENQLQLTLLNRLYEALSRSLELDSVLDAIAQITLEVSEAERAFILLAAGDQLYFGAGRDRNGPLGQQASRDISRSVARRVIESGEGVYVYDMAENPEFSQKRSVVSLQISSVVAVPLTGQSGITGVLYVDSRHELLTALQRRLAGLTAVSNVASLAVESAKLYRQATVDGPTGLYVRSFFMLRLEEELRRSMRYKRSFSLLVIDIDRFKKVNDTYGHLVGDQIIQHVAQSIRRSIRAGVDLPARYGGDEMVVLLPETSAEGAMIVAERVRSILNGTPGPAAQGQSVGVTVSIGVAAFPGAGETASALFAFADQALYQAKEQGRDRVVLFQP